MQLRPKVAVLIVVAMIGISLVVPSSGADLVRGSLSNNSSSGSSEQENAQEETAEAVAPDSVAGVDIALFSAWMWIISIAAIIILAAIIAVLLVRWQRPPDDEY